MQTRILIVAVLAIIATAGALMYFTQKNDSPSLLSGEQTVSNNEDADIAELQAQINTLVKIVATLQELLVQKNALTLR